MHPTNTLTYLITVIGLASATPSLHKRDCHGSGVSWPNRDDAHAKMIDACKKVLANKDYVGGERDSHCVNLDSNTKMDLEIANISGGTRRMPESECISGLGKEIIGCGQGGRSKYTNWEYSSDPNAGQC